jgi:predicted acylesterase/phospholipase RssA
VIAVSVVPTPEELRQCDISTPSPSSKSPSLISRHLNYLAPGNILDIMRRSSMGAQMRLAQLIEDNADVSSRPTLCNVSFKDYPRYRELIDNGRETATMMLLEIKHLATEPLSQTTN